MTRGTVVSASGRDAFLDAIRSFAIVRVVTVHMLGLAPIALLWWPVPTFILPGMPIVFFVAGALSLRALDPDRSKRMNSETFWRDRFRRLLLPYWAFFAVVLLASWLIDLLNTDEATSVDHARALFGFVPLVHPITSPVAHASIGHMWFLVCISQLLVLAPALVRLHRRFPVVLWGSSFALFVVLPFLNQYTPVIVRPELNSIALFTMFFVAGFWYTDGWLRKEAGHRYLNLLHWPQALMVSAVFSLAAFVVWRFQSPGSIYDTAWVHGLLGIGGLCLVLAARPAILVVATRFSRQLAVLNRRALTIYLWGWPTSLLSAMLVNFMGLTGWLGLLSFFGFAVLSLICATAVYGPLEDRAARRRVRTSAPQARRGVQNQLTSSPGTEPAGTESAGTDRPWPKTRGS